MTARAREDDGQEDQTAERRDRFIITELDPCSCDMRRFSIEDSSDNTSHTAHVGLLNPHDLGHEAVSALLRAERKAHGDNANVGER